MPKISVIIPVYHVEKYLHQCVNSILAQTFTDFELILIDDGSPDNCPAICDEYAARDNRVVVVHQENGGVSFARNTALDIAKGEYITFCDSDDYYVATWLEDLYFGIADADVAIGQYFTISDEGSIGKRSNHDCGICTIQNANDRISYTIRDIFGGTHGWEVWTRLFRAEIIRRNHIRFCESCGNFAEDLGFVLEYMLYAEKVVSLPTVGYCYRVRNGSMMQSSKDKVKLDAMNEVSLHYISAIRKGRNDSQWIRIIPILHFLIMHNQYIKVIGTEQYPNLKRYIDTIRAQNEWRTVTRQIFGCYKELIQLYGKHNARRVLLFSNYCLHGNWKRFTIESAIAYKWFIKEI